MQEAEHSKAAAAAMGTAEGPEETWVGFGQGLFSRKIYNYTT
jgi:hypothetical protein